jgi:hypothetical protein
MGGSGSPGGSGSKGKKSLLEKHPDDVSTPISQTTYTITSKFTACTYTPRLNTLYFKTRTLD